MCYNSLQSVNLQDIVICYMLLLKCEVVFINCCSVLEYIKIEHTNDDQVKIKALLLKRKDHK